MYFWCICISLAPHPAPLPSFQSPLLCYFLNLWLWWLSSLTEIHWTFFFPILLLPHSLLNSDNNHKYGRTFCLVLYTFYFFLGFYLFIFFLYSLIYFQFIFFLVSTLLLNPPIEFSFWNIVFLSFQLTICFSPIFCCFLFLFFFLLYATYFKLISIIFRTLLGSEQYWVENKSYYILSVSTFAQTLPIWTIHITVAHLLKPMNIYWYIIITPNP